MAETSIAWIKLSTSFYDNYKIKLIKNAYRNGHAIVTVWVETLALAGKLNDSGIIRSRSPEGMAFIDELSLQLGEKKELISRAFDVFVELEMVEIIAGNIVIKNWAKYQDLDLYEEKKQKAKERVNRYRARQRLIAKGCPVDG